MIACWFVMFFSLVMKSIPIQQLERGNGPCERPSRCADEHTVKSEGRLSVFLTPSLKEAVQILFWHCNHLYHLSSSTCEQLESSRWNDIFAKSKHANLTFNNAFEMIRVFYGRPISANHASEFLWHSQWRKRSGQTVRTKKLLQN